MTTKTTPCDDSEVMRIWREVGLPEEFLGNGGTNHKLVAFAFHIRANTTKRWEDRTAADGLVSAVAEIDRLTGECSGLAASQCHDGYGDEFGNWRCKYQDQIKRLRTVLQFVCDISGEELIHAKVGTGAEVALRHINRKSAEAVNAE